MESRNTEPKYNKQDLVKPFFYPGGSAGVLLIHGFTACPIDLEPLGSYLNRTGYTVSAPLLAGHGTTPELLAQTAWDDWLESAIIARQELAEQCSKLYIIGHSMGGLLALAMAARGMAEKVVSINAPILYKDRELHQAHKLLGVRAFVEKPFHHTEISINKEGLPHFSYSVVPVSCFVSLNQAIASLRTLLPAIRCPALIVQGMEDKTVDPESARLIADSIAGPNKEVIFWPGGDHYLPISAQRDALAAAVRKFLENDHNQSKNPS